MPRVATPWAGVDAARHLEVLDGGTVDVAEEGGALIAAVGDVGGDGVATTVKGAAKRVHLHIA